MEEDKDVSQGEVTNCSEMLMLLRLPSSEAVVIIPTSQMRKFGGDSAT